MARDASAAQAKTIPRKLLSIVYLCVVAMSPIAVVISVTHHHWFALFFSVVASAVQVPLAIVITRQSGPAMKLIAPIVLAAGIGYVMIASALG
jgi:putative effector of murein hydrolase